MPISLEWDFFKGDKLLGSYIQITSMAKQVLLSPWAYVDEAHK